MLEQATHVKEVVTQADILDFPTVSTHVRVIPNDIIRSALFTVTNSNRTRTYLAQKPIACIGNTKIIYTGEELRQDDEDVWMQLIYLSTNQQGESVSFYPYRLLADLDWPKRTQYKEKLRQILSRLSATEIQIYNTNLKEGYSISLVRKFKWQDREGGLLKKWQIWFEKDILDLFQMNHFSWISWQERKQLPPLAKWLHAFYSSHKEPGPIKVATLHRLCGSKSAKLKHFRADLKKALILLREISFLIDFKLEETSDLIFVLRNNLSST